MLRFSIVVGCAVLAAACIRQANADETHWRVVLSSSSSTIALPQLPNDGFYFDGAGLADGGAGLLGFRYRSGDRPDGLWTEHGTVLSPYAEIGATGAAGPGRSGAESADVFTAIDFRADSIGDGRHAFGGRAGNDDVDSTGLWQSAGSRNTEFARIGVDGAFGPGLGEGWTYKSFHNVNNTDADYDLRALRNGRVVFAGRIASPGATLGSDGLSVYVPGEGNRPCMLQGSIDDAYGPGIVGATFDAIASVFSVSPRGEIYASAYARENGGFSGDGIWQFCDGAPQLDVLTGVTDELGPGLPGGTAVFGGEGNGLRNYLAPSEPGSFYFSSGGRMSTASGAPTFLGLFHHGAGHNAPVLLRYTEGALGPHIDGYVFNPTTVPLDIKAAGKYGALLENISPADDYGSVYPGLWRLTPEGGAEPVAISGFGDAYAPAPGRTWNGTFYKYAVFDNGDIVTLANTRNTASGSTVNSLWRLSRGQAPVEILKPGDLVEVPTANGILNLPIDSINAQYLIGLPATAGHDTWYTANGQLLISVEIHGYESTSTLIRSQGAHPDYIFDGGFD